MASLFSRLNIVYSSLSLESADELGSAVAVARVQHVYGGDAFGMAAEGRLPYVEGQQGKREELAKSEARWGNHCEHRGFFLLVTLKNHGSSSSSNSCSRNSSNSSSNNNNTVATTTTIQ